MPRFVEPAYKAGLYFNTGRCTTTATAKHHSKQYYCAKHWLVPNVIILTLCTTPTNCYINTKLPSAKGNLIKALPAFINR